MIVRWLAKYFLFYLQALDIIVQRVIDPFLQLLIGYPIQYCIDIGMARDRSLTSESDIPSHLVFFL